MLGMAEGSGTRSSLLWEVRRLLNECEELPDVLLMENVPQVHSKSNMPHFQKWLEFLESKGYSSYWKDLNAKDYGVAQSRNRTFVISILGNYSYSFPEPFKTDFVIKDYLENKVDEKYYNTSEKAKDLIDKLIVDGKILTDRQTDRQTDSTDRQLIYAQNMLNWSQYQTASQQGMMQESVTTSMKPPESVKSLGFIEKGTGQHQSNTVYDSNGISPCLNAVNWREPIKVIECKRLD